MDKQVLKKEADVNERNEYITRLVAPLNMQPPAPAAGAPCAKCTTPTDASNPYMGLCAKCHDAGAASPVAPPEVNTAPAAPAAGVPVLPKPEGLMKEAAERICEKCKKFTDGLSASKCECPSDAVGGTDHKDEVIQVHLMKEAASKWKGGQELIAKHNGASACVAYVDEADKIYIIKVCGTMSPSYYTYQEAHEIFKATKEDESKWAKSHGV